MAKRGAKGGLTRSKRMFVIALAGGKKQGDAYLEAYPRSARWSDGARAVAGARLLADHAVHDFYVEELARVEEEARKSGLWDRKLSMQKRIDMLNGIEEEIARRKRAILAEAETLRMCPPADRAPAEVVADICRILQKAVYSASSTSAYAALCDGLDKLACIAQTSEEKAPVVFMDVDPED